MIADKNSFSSHSSDQLPNSHRVYVGGWIHKDVQVPFREVTLSPTRRVDGALEPNEPVRMYDTSGPWGDPSQNCDAREGLPALREKWILGRGDVERYEGRGVKPEDDGYLSRQHADHATRPENTRSRLEEFPSLKPSAVAREPGTPGHTALVRPAGDHHPGDGVHRDPREPGKTGCLRGGREQNGRARRAEPAASRPLLRCGGAQVHHARVRPGRSGARAGHHPRQHQPPRAWSR